MDDLSLFYQKGVTYDETEYKITVTLKDDGEGTIDNPYIISNNDFIRTTEERHWKVVQDIFTKLYNNGDIYLGKYKGWYCTPCESFWTDTQVGPDHICPDPSGDPENH